MNSSEDKDPRQLEFRTVDSVNLHFSMNDRPVTWLAPFLRLIERPINYLLRRRQENRWKKSNRTTT
jgi:hypothetical protein